jgi:predicted LPLAT superfamily acyltransferase
VKKIPLWSSRSLGGRLQHQFFYALVKLRLLCLARAFIYLVTLWYVLKPSVRRRSLPYLSRIFPHARRWQQFLNSYQLGLNFAFSLLDRTVARITGAVEQVASEEVLQHINQALAAQKGLILLSAHFGSVQSSMVMIKKLQRPLNICIYKDGQDVDLHYFENGQASINVIHADKPFGGSIEMLDALRRGEIVCFMGDRLLYANDPSLKSRFLGDAASFPYMPYALAGKTGAPAAILFMPRLGHSKFKLQLEALFSVSPTASKLPQNYQKVVDLFVGRLEKVVRQYPFQFFVFFDMWREPGHD